MTGRWFALLMVLLAGGNFLCWAEDAAPSEPATAIASRLEETAKPTPEKEPAIGFVTTVRGKDIAAVGLDGKPRGLTRNSHVYLGDVIKTGKNGRLQIQFVDKTVISVMPASETKIEAFTYDPESGQAEMRTYLENGYIRVMTGVIGKVAPGKFSVTTPGAVICVRGTDYSVIQMIRGTMQVIHRGATDMASRQTPGPGAPPPPLPQVYQAGQGGAIGPQGQPSGPFVLSPQQMRAIRQGIAVMPTRQQMMTPPNPSPPPPPPPATGPIPRSLMPPPVKLPPEPETVPPASALALAGLAPGTLALLPADLQQALEKLLPLVTAETMERLRLALEILAQMDPEEQAALTALLQQLEQQLALVEGLDIEALLAQLEQLIAEQGEEGQTTADTFSEVLAALNDIDDVKELEDLLADNSDWIWVQKTDSNGYLVYSGTFDKLDTNNGNAQIANAATKEIYFEEQYENYYVLNGDDYLTQLLQDESTGNWWSGLWYYTETDSYNYYLQGNPTDNPVYILVSSSAYAAASVDDSGGG